jgi:hypothetical protein
MTQIAEGINQFLNNGTATYNPNGRGGVPLQPTKEQPQQNSQSRPVEQAHAKEAQQCGNTAHSVEARLLNAERRSLS